MNEGILSASIPVTLDGQTYSLRYRAHAFIVYAEATDRDLLLDMQEIGSGQRSFGRLFGILRDVLWAGMVEAHPEITREAVGRMFDPRDVETLAMSISEAIRRSMPELKTPRPTKAGKRADSRLINGPDSGPSIETPAESPPPSSAA